MIYSFFVYARAGKCIYYEEWNRNEPMDPAKTAADQRLMYGMLYSLRQFCAKMSANQ